MKVDAKNLKNILLLFIVAAKKQEKITAYPEKIMNEKENFVEIKIIFKIFSN